MKLVSYLKAGEIQLGAIVNESLYNLQSVNEKMPKNIIDFFQSGNDIILQTEKQLSKIVDKSLIIEPIKDFSLLAPVPRPTSCRDGYAFRQHVESAPPSVDLYNPQILERLQLNISNMMI